MRQETQKDYDYLLKVIVLGDANVGKTNILGSFVEKHFKETYVATIGVDFSTKIMEVKRHRIKLQLWDTAGQERFRTMTQTYYKGAAGILLAYAINCRASFVNLQKWIAQIRDKLLPNTCMVIVGNKADLEKDREISHEEGMQLARRTGLNNQNVRFFQTSAKLGTNINELFTILADQMFSNLDHRQVEEKKQRLHLHKNESVDTQFYQQKKEHCGC